MKAWMFDGIAAPLRADEIDRPTPGPGEVLIKVKAAGLCHSDVGYMEGQIPARLSFPYVLGHEASGVIASLGRDVVGWSAGDRVVASISIDDCPGVTRDGAYAEYFVASASSLVRIPEGMSWEQAAAATDAGLVSYTGVVVFGETSSSDRVAIVGLGGLGMTGAQIALATGATVIGVEPREVMWDRARQVGVQELYADVAELEGRDLDVVVDFAGFGSTTTGAIRAVKRQGRVVLVGVGRSEFTFNSIDLVSRAIELRGATVLGNKSHLEEVLELMGAGKVSVQTETIDFAAIPDGLERLKNGTVSGRLVARFAD
ncbi:zinc-binding dehydrogenase [Microbacterium sp. NPDC079995]|uniref:zinc-binding dehydrogenase n=1 Tax=unclassified Microbacterium TaxID=2609290 RepID=UPI00344F188F